MVHSRSVVGHQAKLLRNVLQDKCIKAEGQQQARIIRAIGLCDSFLNSCNATPAGLEALEKVVAKALRKTNNSYKRAHNQQPQRSDVSVSNKHHNRVSSVDGFSSKVGSCPRAGGVWQFMDVIVENLLQASSILDCTMPADLRLERKAFAKPVGFAQVAKLQDDIAKKDDLKRAANKARFHARTRNLLDGQMAELAAQRVS